MSPSWLAIWNKLDIATMEMEEEMEVVPEGYDADVWNALPQDIKNELLGPARPRNPQHVATQSFLSFTKPDTSKRAPLKDSTFPPSYKSIDGRNICPNSSEIRVPSCDCGFLMKLSRVSRIGRNRGRHYYACARKACQAYLWADHNIHPVPSADILWMPFQGEYGWKLVTSEGFSADDIVQGGVGDCWFLSAVAVLCDRRDLMEKVVVQPALASGELQQFRFFLGGEWRVIGVDLYLPCRTSAPIKKKNSTRGVSAGYQSLLYSRSRRSQLWVPLLEKAYAKAYECYAAISGGHIPEALFDLTGCPCEAIHLSSPSFHSEDTWERLVQYRQEGFPMGCSTDFSGEGIVGNHAYSILDVREVFGAVAGEQLSIKDFFGVDVSTEMSQCRAARMSEGELSHSSTGISAEQECIHEIQMTGRLRLIRIRNPWGQREWKGTFSASSSLWTSKLREMLRPSGSPAGDGSGTFWMTYHDFLRRFSTIDVCKAYRGKAWQITCVRDTLGVTARGGIATDSEFTISVHLGAERRVAHAYLSLLQDSKRGGTPQWADGPLPRTYWYADLVCILRRQSAACEDGEVICAVFSAPMRSSLPVELYLPHGDYKLSVYRFIPLTDSSRAQHYFVHLYSPDNVTITKAAGPRDYARSSVVAGGGRENIKRFKVCHGDPSLRAERSLIMYLVCMSKQKALSGLLTYTAPGSVAVDLQNNVAVHKLHSSDGVCGADGVDLYVLCGNGMNILFLKRNVSNSGAYPFGGQSDGNTVVDLTSDSDFDECGDPVAISDNRRPRAALVSSVRNRPATVRTSSATAVMTIACQLECDVRVISPFRESPVVTGDYTTKHPVHSALFSCLNLPLNCIRVVAVLIDNQYSDGFELDRKNYIRCVYVSCTESTDDILKIESYIQDDRNIMYPNYFRCFHCD